MNEIKKLNVIKVPNEIQDENKQQIQSHFLNA